MNYIPSENIVNEVKNRMASYFAANKVDESILPRVIRKCVGQMGLRILPAKRTVVVLSNYKAELPKDLNKITLALLCDNRTTYVKDELRSGPKVTTVKADQCCNICTDECGNVIKIVHEDVFEKTQYDNFLLLKASKLSFEHCAKSCMNLKSRCKNEFEVKTIKGGKVLQTTIAEGLLYIEYLSELEDEEGFMVPDNETIKDWLFEEMRREIYTYMWDNGEDVMQRMQHSERELMVKQERARQIYSRREVSEYYNTANLLAQRYGQMERWLSPYNWYYTPNC